MRFGSASRSTTSGEYSRHRNVSLVNASLYANAISMRAAHHRLAPRLRVSLEDESTTRDLREANSSHHRFFECSVLRWAEAPFLLEVVEAAISLMKAGVALHRRKVLQYCPGRTFLRLVGSNAATEYQAYL